MVYAARWCFSTNPELTNKSEDPESTRDISCILGIVSEVTRMMRASGVVMEALRVTIVCAQTDETQPPGGMEVWRLLNIFLPPCYDTIRLRLGPIPKPCPARSDPQVFQPSRVARRDVSRDP